MSDTAASAPHYRFENRALNRPRTDLPKSDWRNSQL